MWWRSYYEIFFLSSRENCWKKRGLCIIPTKFGISFTIPFLNQVIALPNLSIFTALGPHSPLCTVARLPKCHSADESACQCRRHKQCRLDPWIGEDPLWESGRRKWQPTPVFLSGRFHGQRSLAGYSPWDCKKSDMTEHDTTKTHCHGSRADQRNSLLFK